VRGFLDSAGIIKRLAVQLSYGFKHIEKKWIDLSYIL
jgi:hypothetical protein